MLLTDLITCKFNSPITLNYLFSYFRHDEMFYGFAVFKRHLKGDKLSRDAIMRSVGVITEHYAFFGPFKDFLEEFARFHSHIVFY